MASPLPRNARDPCSAPRRPCRPHEPTPPPIPRMNMGTGLRRQVVVTAAHACGVPPRPSQEKEMSMLRSRFIQSSFVLALGALGLATQARGETTTFTYQGQLKDAGVPAEGTYDF